MKPIGNRFSSRAVYLMSGVLGLLLAGCNIIPPPSADPTRYYVLSSSAASAPVAVPSAGALTLGLKNVEVSPYLRKGTLVVRTGENEVTFPNDARWGVPIEQDIARALRDGLSAATAVGRVLVQPFPFEGKRDYDVHVQVLRCEGVVAQRGGGATASFSALIEINSTAGGAPVVARKLFVAPDAAWDGKDFAQLAAQLSAAVSALGTEVVGLLPKKN